MAPLPIFPFLTLNLEFPKSWREIELDNFKWSSSSLLYSEKADSDEIDGVLNIWLFAKEGNAFPQECKCYPSRKFNNLQPRSNPPAKI